MKISPMIRTNWIKTSLPWTRYAPLRGPSGQALNRNLPDRTEVPKTLIFAKDDSHAEDIVKIVREEFGKGNDFAQKITYKTTGKKTDDLIAEFRTATSPDRSDCGHDCYRTDIKPLEVIWFMRSVKSRTFFEQMKGRGVRVISNEDLQAVTPDAKARIILLLLTLSVSVNRTRPTHGHWTRRNRLHSRNCCKRWPWATKSLKSFLLSLHVWPAWPISSPIPLSSKIGFEK